jgi:putative transposase
MARALPRMDLTPQEREELDRIVRADTSEQRAVLRARIILLADEMLSTQEIMNMLGVSKPVVVKWRSRFVEHRLDGLRDASGRGRPRTHGPDIRLKIATEACRPPEGSTHWSARDLAKHIGGVSHVTVHRVLAAEKIKPHLQEMWLNSQDPDFEAKQAEIIGLYLDPPENALVLCVDEKTGVQALGRKAPDKPVRPGTAARREFEYVRHGTKSLLAALAVHEGTVTGSCYDRHSNAEFLDFLRILDCTYPSGELHLIVDNLSVHKHENVRRWLESHPRIKLHFTPTHASWLNQIEIWFSILSRKLLKRGIFNSTNELVAAILDYIERYNQTAQPFRWTYTGDPLTV